MEQQPMDKRKALKEGQSLRRAGFCQPGTITMQVCPGVGGGGTAELVGFQTTAGSQGSKGREDNSDWLSSLTEKISQSEPREAKVISITLSRYFTVAPKRAS